MSDQKLLPKILFRYSNVYDSHWKKSSNVNSPDLIYPEAKEIFQRKEEIVEYWKGYGQEILEAISDVSTLNWYSESIVCYLVGRCVPFSDPLTMPIYLRRKSNFNFEDFRDTLVHELIHNILVDNFFQLKTFIEWRDSQYPDINSSTKIHIAVNAIHKAVYLKLFDEERLKEDIDFCDKYLPDYKLAWDIVEEVGHEEIILKFNPKS